MNTEGHTMAGRLGSASLRLPSDLNPQAAEFKPLNLQPVVMNPASQNFYPVVLPQILLSDQKSMVSQTLGISQVSVAPQTSMSIQASVPAQNSMPPSTSVLPHVLSPPQMPISARSMLAHEPWQPIGPTHYPPLEFDQMAQNFFYNDPNVRARNKITRRRGKKKDKEMEKLQPLGHEEVINDMRYRARDPEHFTFTNATSVRGITSRIGSHNDTNNSITELQHKLMYARAQSLPEIYAAQILGSGHDPETMPFLAQFFLNPKDRNEDIDGRETAAKELHHRVMEYQNATRPYTSIKDVRDGLVRDLVLGWFSGQSSTVMLEPWKYGHAVVIFHLQALAEKELKLLVDSIGEVIKSRGGQESGKDGQQG
jgi:hypothetical protein